MRSAAHPRCLVLIASLASACFVDGGLPQGLASASGSGASDSGDASGSGSSGLATTGGPACEPRQVSLEIPTPKVVLMLDKSGSMSNLAWDHDADPNTPETHHWPVLHGIVATIPAAIYTTVELGLTLFPSRAAASEEPQTLCQVGAAVDVVTQLWGRDEVVEAMPAADATISGGTPIDAGLQLSFDHLRSFDAAVPRAVLVVADGAANCKTGVDGVQNGETLDTAATATAAAALADGIRTFVVALAVPPGLTPDNPLDGVPSEVDSFATLQDIAVAGGTLAAYDAQTQAALGAAISEILAARMIPCEGLTTPLVAGEQIVGVALAGGEPLPKTDPCAEGPGWRPTDGASTAVSLCAPTCAALQQQRALVFDTACGP